MKRFIFLAFTLILSNFLILPSFSSEFSGTKPIVTSLLAQKESDNKVKLTWTLPDGFTAASIAVFRSRQDFTSRTVLSMSPAADVPARTTSYTDTPELSGSYYYALLARDKNGNLFNVIVPGSNATIKAVKLEREDNSLKARLSQEEESYKPSFLRNMPLPYLDLISDIDRKPTVFSIDAMKAGRDLSGKYYDKKPAQKALYVFEQDLTCAPSGDDYYLFQSLKTYFIKKDYKNSVSDLRRFLSTRRDPYTSARAAFYLAESEYFSRNYKEALKIFLSLEDVFPALSKSWTDSALDLYELPK